MKENVFSVEYILENGLDKLAYGFVYITICLINGKKYIGQKMFRKDWKYYLGSGTLFKRAIKKYGRENFKREIIAMAFDEEELNKLEVKFIKNNIAVENEEYYNIASGGDSGNNFAGKTKEEMIKIKTKISNSNKGKHNGDKNPKWGKGYLLLGKNNPIYKKGYLFKGLKNHACRKIICLTTGEIFDYALLASTKYNIDLSSIIRCCRNKNQYAGKNPVNKKPMIWMYFEDYKSNNFEIEKDIKITNSKKIICLTTNIIFNSVFLASNWCGVASTNICANLKGKAKSAGKHPETGESLKWMYYDEYIKLQEAN